MISHKKMKCSSVKQLKIGHETFFLLFSTTCQPRSGRIPQDVAWLAFLLPFSGQFSNPSSFQSPTAFYQAELQSDIVCVNSEVHQKAFILVPSDSPCSVSCCADVLWYMRFGQGARSFRRCGRAFKTKQTCAARGMARCCALNNNWKIAHHS